jgi:hypothetical protein
MIDDNELSVFIVQRKGQIIYANKSAQTILNEGREDSVVSGKKGNEKRGGKKKMERKKKILGMRIRDQKGVKNIFDIIEYKMKEKLGTSLEEALQGHKAKIHIFLKVRKAEAIEEKKEVEEEKKEADNEIEERNEVDLNCTVVEGKFGLDVSLLKQGLNPKFDFLTLLGYEIFEIKIEKCSFKSSVGIMLSCNNLMKIKILSHCFSIHQLHNRKNIDILRSKIQFGYLLNILY